MIAFWQIGNSIMTTRLWIVTPGQIVGFFLSAVVCEGCREYHVMVVKATAK